MAKNIANHLLYTKRNIDWDSAPSQHTVKFKTMVYEGLYTNKMQDNQNKSQCLTNSQPTTTKLPKPNR